MRTHPADITGEEDFLHVMERNSGIITKICYYYAKDADEYHDLRQDVLTNMWAYRKSFRGDSSITTWIYRLSLNTCISALRKRKHAGKEICLDSLTDIQGESDSISSMHKEMHKLISRLPASEKAIILLWLDDMSYDDMASIIGCPRNTLATRLRRIKDKLVKLSNS